jgi:cholest-4-en-3-one 26-monooxygenase
VSSVQFDFMDEDWFATGDPDAVWRELRTHDPVHWHEPRGMPPFWLVMKHADVVHISRDGETFVCERGTGPASPADGSAPPNERLPPHQRGRTLNQLDPPDHTLMRRLVSRAFTPKTVLRLEPIVMSCADEVLTSFARSRGGDFVSRVATQLPLAVLSALMGFPSEDWQRLADWTRDMAREDPAGVSRSDEEREMAANIARAELIRYLRDLVSARRASPRDDLVSELCSIEEQGKLDDTEIMWFCILLVNAGHDTTRNALAGGVHALLERPEEKARLAENVETAVEEVLRWTSPIVFFGRFATRDTELRGRTIRAGQRIVMLYPSANRDEEIFAEPDRFDVRRAPNDHVAFGVGRHSCLGAALARLQLRVLLPLVFERLPELRLGGTPERLRSNFSAGFNHLPLRVGAD